MGADTTSIAKRTAGSRNTAEVQVAEDQERQFHEMLEFCPAALAIVDEDGHLLFHNARLRERGGQLLNEEVIWKTKQG